MADSRSSNTARILITGGSGLVGRYLTSALLSKGYEVSHLSRKANQFGRVRVFRWDPEKQILDPVVFEGVDYIIHLAGANLGEKRWTIARKKEIIASRVDSAKLLLRIIEENQIKLKAFISASAIGYYGSVTADRIFKENDKPGEDFMGTSCRLWEEAADNFNKIGIRTVKIRSAIILESALSKLLKPARFGIFPVLGSGKQYMPFIHIDDLVSIYLLAISDETIEGAYNAVSPQHVTQQEFMQSLARAMNKPFFHPPVPAFVLKLILGEMADVVLKGSRISCEKINSKNYSFDHSDLLNSLTELIS